ncbi:MAG: phosphoadenosine phosphosulfate reductase family protein [Cetobacterium sp.]
MKPVFREEMDYLGIPPHFADILWVNLQSFSVFTKDFEKVNFGKNIRKFPFGVSNFITHKEYCQHYFEKYTCKKVSISEEHLKEYMSDNKYEQYLISVSGGKDSTIMEHFLRERMKGYENRTMILFCNTTNETHQTYNYVKKYYPKATILNPREGFYKYIDRMNFVPSRIARACCGIYKEGNITGNFDNNKKILHFVGIRRDESLRRSTYNRVGKGAWATKEALKNWDMYLPLVDFEDLDVWSYLLYHDLDFNILYKFGFGRVGCAFCPYRTNYEMKLTEHFLPTYFKRWIDVIGNIFVRDGKAVILNCTKEEYIKGGWRGGVFRATPTPEVIEDFANIKGISIEESEKYFKKGKCTCCGSLLNKDTIAMNMKTCGRNTDSRLCLNCLSKFLETPIETLKEQIADFKNSGCNLF